LHRTCVNSDGRSRGEFVGEAILGIYRNYSNEGLEQEGVDRNMKDLILVGGKAKRMGGYPKPLKFINGYTIFERQI